ncbi:unnamed protein product [Ectocarpus sp. CCAP 1310/34]|nr:unnamed protein product [Ectocarpus sp. CCAP 1310/34]
MTHKHTQSRHSPTTAAKEKKAEPAAAAAAATRNKKLSLQVFLPPPLAVSPSTSRLSAKQGGSKRNKKLENAS